MDNGIKFDEVKFEQARNSLNKSMTNISTPISIIYNNLRYKNEYKENKLNLKNDIDDIYNNLLSCINNIENITLDMDAAISIIKNKFNVASNFSSLSVNVDSSNSNTQKTAANIGVASSKGKNNTNNDKVKKTIFNIKDRIRNMYASALEEGEDIDTFYDQNVINCFLDSEDFDDKTKKSIISLIFNENGGLDFYNQAFRRDNHDDIDIWSIYYLLEGYYNGNKKYESLVKLSELGIYADANNQLQKIKAELIEKKPDITKEELENNQEFKDICYNIYVNLENKMVELATELDTKHANIIITDYANAELEVEKRRLFDGLSVASELSQNYKIKHETLDPGKDFKVVASTLAMFTVKYAEGILSSAEEIVDGAIFIVGTGVSLAVGLFDEDAGTDVYNLTRTVVSYDCSSSVSDAFFEKTDLGKEINRNSLFTYDSAEADMVKGSAEIVASTFTTGHGGQALKILKNVGVSAQKYTKEEDGNAVEGAFFAFVNSYKSNLLSKVDGNGIMRKISAKVTDVAYSEVSDYLFTSEYKGENSEKRVAKATSSIGASLIKHKGISKVAGKVGDFVINLIYDDNTNTDGINISDIYKTGTSFKPIVTSIMDLIKDNTRKTDNKYAIEH